MYYANDKVSHPSYGACTVSGICDLNFTGAQITYYKLIPCVDSGASVFVPVDNAKKIGLRPLMTKAQATSLMNFLLSIDEQWPSDSREKSERYRSATSNNSIDGIHEILSVMGSIIKHKSEKELGSADKAMLENIQKKVLPELSVVLGISMNTLVQKVEESVLQRGQENRGEIPSGNLVRP